MQQEAHDNMAAARIGQPARYRANADFVLKLLPDMDRDVVVVERRIKASLAEGRVQIRDLNTKMSPGVPWYQPLVDSGLSLASFRSSAAGRRLTVSTLWLFERLRTVQRGTARVAAMLDTAAASFVLAGQFGIFSSMFFIHA